MFDFREVFKITVLISGILLIFPTALNGFTVDNHLVSARNDCFERIALEAMLPIEKTFRTEDTNALKMCKDKCTQAGERCQSISFGVHRRGNGTCQLSTEKFDASNGRPRGVIFDPDFDLYARKTSCFDLNDNTIAQQEGAAAGASDAAVASEGYGGVVATTQPLHVLSNLPGADPSLLIADPSNPTSTTLNTDQSPPPTLVYGSTQFYAESPLTTQAPKPIEGDRLLFSHDITPLYKYPMLYEQNYPAPNEEVYIPGGYASNVPEVEGHYRPGQPLDDSARPSGPPRPIFGMGYGNGYSYGKPERYRPSESRPHEHEQSSTIFGSLPDQRPTADRDYASVPGYYTSDRAESPERPDRLNRPGYPNRPDQAERPDQQDRPIGSNYMPPNRPGYGQISPTYYPRPEYVPSTPTHVPADARPTDDVLPTNGNRPPIDYTNRPDPPQQNYGPQSSTSRPAGSRPGTMTQVHESNRYDYIRRNGTVVRPMTTSYNDDKTIAIFFNPDDYQQNKRRPGGHHDRNRVGYPMDVMKACFRRVLAGKRIAPHWVRRTIACERVEECMRECGNEKRFSCEGFNYRLDPSGHGQGDCELIEIPLAQMDLYSSPHQRDSNLLRHPDYDYYERDRNAPSSCRRNGCKDCSKAPISSLPLHFKPSVWGDKPSHEEHYISSQPPSGSSYSGDPHRYSRPSDTAIDHYRPLVRPPPPVTYIHRPSSSDYHHNSYEISSHGSSYFEHTAPSSYGGSSSGGSGPIDRYDLIRPDEHRYRPSRPDRWESIPSSTGYDSGYHPRPEPDRIDKYRPPYHPGPDYSPYRPSSHFDGPTGPSSSYHAGPSPPASHNYLDRGGPPPAQSSNKFVPYLVGVETDWGSYGGGYGGNYNKQSSYWGLNDYRPQKDHQGFNYLELGGSQKKPPHDSNSVSYGSSSHGSYDSDRDRHDYRHQWTRRPGPDECSAKTSEGFRLHKTVVKHSSSVPTLTECERLCSGQDGFECHTYSYRYSPMGRDNCMLCDRPVNNLDYYVDIEPDRDYDIYSMADDLDVCKKPARIDAPGSTTALSDPRNAQCFFRAIDTTRFFKSIVRDSLTVRSVGECELECIKSTKFTCRAFAFRYGKQRNSGIIDNCQLSDWPVRDMDKERHLILDTAFDVFERASYGHGCEIQPIVDEKHKKSVCYLGYGAPAKLLSAAIKKVVSVASVRDCKKACVRFRETTQFKCYSFSFGTHATSYNCEMSDLDQTELKLDVHYQHSNSNQRDYWLFAWNPFDWTCRDKVNTIGGTRVNNDRRMDIFREPGDLAWRHYTVSGKACRRSSPCAKNLISGFYSCETDGEIGSWDYCCNSDHPCGYSQGFDYPWCFVGDEPDQWRKCSDRYYPGNQTQTTSSADLTPSKEDKKKHIQSPSGSSSSAEYQRPPRPGGLQSLSDFAAARLWPVTYLYSEGPPNSTELSNFVDCNKENC